MSTGKIIGIIVVLALILGGVYLLVGDNLNLGGSSADTPNENVVATVNGEEITDEEFQAQLAVAMQNFQAQGANLDDPNNVALIRKQVLDEMINNKVVLQGLAGANIEVSQEVVDVEFDRVKAQSGSDEAFQTALTQAGLTEAQLKENLRRQLMAQQYLRGNVDVDLVTVTEAEIQTFYDQNVAGQENAPAFADVEAQIRQQITANKQQQLINQFVDGLRAAADVEIFLETENEVESL